MLSFSQKMSIAVRGTWRIVPMTMQVGMLASNGIVLASDRKVTRNLTLDQTRDAANLGSDQTKIEYRSEKRVAISCADDLDAARGLANRIMDGLINNCSDEGKVIEAIKQTARETFFEDRHRVQCLIAVECPEWSLFKYTYLPTDSNNPSCPWNETCEKSLSYEFAGNVTNPAIFWAGKYHDDRLTVEQLTPIAAQLVISARNFDSYAIDGLDIVQCTDNGVSLLSNNVIRDLKNKSDKLEELTRKHFDIPHFHL